MSKSKKTDGLLYQVYNEFDGIGQEVNFLQCCFSFLNRRSNFLSKPGVAKQVQSLVNKYIDDAKKKEIERQNALKESYKPKKLENPPPTQTQTKKNEKKQDNIENNNDNDNENNDNNSSNNDDIKMVDKQNKNENENKNNDKNDDNNNENDEDEDDDKRPKPVGNGGTTDKYVWTQTLKEVEVKIEVPDNLRAKHLDVKLGKKSLYVAIKGGKEILKGKFHENIDEDESTWTLDKEFGKSTKTLILTLFKDKDMNWWKGILVGDPEIDTKKIEPESSKLQDLDDETRAAVEKMMFDQRQKRMGKPTSKEIEHADILNKFKQQHPEMDFSNVNWGN